MSEPKKTIEEKRKEVWTSNKMVLAIDAYNKKHPEGLDMSVPSNTDVVFKEFYGKDIMDETPIAVVCGRCKKTKGEKEKDCKCGRPKIYSEDYLAKADEYLRITEDEEIERVKQTNDKKGYEMVEYKLKVRLPSIEGLARYIQVSVQTLYTWEKEHPQFLEVMEELRTKQAEILINKGLSGDYNPTMSKVLLTKHGYREGIDATTLDKTLNPEISDEQYARIIRTKAEKLNNKEVGPGGVN